MKRVSTIIPILFVLALCVGGCAMQVPITRYNGEKIIIETQRNGDHSLYYKAELYENGNLKSESYGYERKISPVLAEVSSVAKSALAGAKDAF